MIRRPNEDVSTGGWTGTPLWSKIDESENPDGNKINGNYGDICILGFVNFSIPEDTFVTQIKIAAYGWASESEP